MLIYFQAALRKAIPVFHLGKHIFDMVYIIEKEDLYEKESNDEESKEGRA